MYPPPQGMEKLKSQVNVTFWFWLMYPHPTPRNWKVEISGQCDILVLADVPPPHPQELKSWNLRSMWHFGSSWCTPLPPRNWNLTKHECYRRKSLQERSSSTFYNLPPPPFQYHYLILCLNRKLMNFNFKWIWIYGLESHPPPLTSTKKMKCSFLDYVQLLMIGRAGWWTQTPSTTPLQPKKWNAHFWITFNFWWLAGLVDGLKPHPPPLSSQKYEMLIFGLHSTSDDWPGWLMDSNPIHHPSPAKKMKWLFSDYVQLLMIGWAGWWTRTPSATPLQPKNWKAHFWITFKFWWSARLVDGLEPHLPPLSSQKMKCSFLDYVQLLMIGQAGRWTRTPHTTPLQPKKWNAHFWITFNFWWSAGLVDGPNPIHHPSPAKKWNARFWIMFNFWWSAGLVDGPNSIHHPSLAKKKMEMFIFGLCSTYDDQLGWLMDSNPICYLSPAKKNEMLIFGLC